MKKNLIIFGIIIAVGITSAITMAFSPRKNLKPSDYGIGITYQQAVQAKKPFIALFYTDWCSYCVRFMPKYKLISDIYKGEYNFVMINADNPASQKLVEEYSISGFPSIFIIDKQIDNRVPIYNGTYDDMSKMRQEFDRYLRIRSMIKK